MTPSTTSIAAVIPAFNRERTVGHAVESVLAQSRPPDEILVVDDGSSDATAQVVERFGAPVRCIRGENLGASEARNRGVRAADSDWVAFLDSDDRWLDRHLERMEAAICATGGAADLYFADLRWPLEEGGTLLWEDAEFGIAGAYELLEDATDWAMLPLQPMMLQASVFRRSSYLRMDGLRSDLRCRHDTDLFLRLCMGGPACAVAGCGTEMTADVSDRSGRVTTTYGPSTPAFWEETLLMYEPLAAEPCLAPRHRRDLASRVCHARIRLARFALAEGDLRAAVRHASRAASSDPGKFARRAARAALRAPAAWRKKPASG